MSGEPPGSGPKRRARHARPRPRTAALVAMPSVLMLGLGLAPGVARADPAVDSPFREGPCVEMPDPADAGEEGATGEEEATGEEADAGSPAEPEPEPEPEPDADVGGDGTPDTADLGAGEATPPPSGSGPTGDHNGDAPSPGAPAGSTPSRPTTPSPGATAPPGEGTGDAPADPGPAGTAEAGEDTSSLRDRLDPLGVGDALRGLGEGLADLVTGGSRNAGPGDAEESPDPTPTDPGTGPEVDSEVGAEPSAPAGGGADRTDAGTPPAGTTGAVGDDPDPAAGPVDPTGEAPAGGPTGPAGETGTSGEGGAGETGTAEKEGGTGATGAKAPAPDDPFAPDAEGKVPFPCPETLRQAGTDEAGPTVVADRPWLLDARYLTLNGLKYHGVVNLTTANGSTKQALKFTADRLDIGDLHQIVEVPDGPDYHVRAARGSNSTFRNGRVTMYTERLEGRLFGLIPIVFDPLHEPPLDLPFAHFTHVRVTQAGQFGGELTIPGMRQYTTGW